MEMETKTGAAGEDPLARSRQSLQKWMETRQFKGYDPFDILNSPLLAGRWARRFPFNILLVQAGKRYGSLWLRRLLRVPQSVNPKTLGLVLAAYCDLSRCGEDTADRANSIIAILSRCRSPREDQFCWGYNWDYYSLRGSEMPAFFPNAIATVFCATALLDAAAVFHSHEAGDMAKSAARFLATRLNRAVESNDQLCFSYTPNDRTRIYNSSLLVGAFLAHASRTFAIPDYLDLARRSMAYGAAQQRPDGSWFYGAGKRQRWIDGFHTGYNLGALLDYRNACGDRTFDDAMQRGYQFYKNNFFQPDRTPKYFYRNVYPVDIHSCAQAILTFCDFWDEDREAPALAVQSAQYCVQNMQSEEGFFFYQRHKLRANRTPYMRWGQAWMLHALARLQAKLYLSRKHEPGKNIVRA